jgi:WD40 repeat protein
LARKPLFGHLGNVNWVSFSPDGSEFFSGGEDGRIYGWKLATGEKIQTFSDHEGPISCFAFHPQKPWIASTAFDGPDAKDVFVWDRKTGQRVHTLRNHTGAVTGLAFHPEGKLLATASHDKTITLWNCESGEMVRVLRDHRSALSCVAFSPDGSRIASSASPLRAGDFRPDDDENFVWDTATGAVIHRMRGHRGRPVSLAFTSDGKRLATAGHDGQVKLWDVKTGQEILTLIARDVDPDDPDAIARITSLAFDRNGSLLTGSDRGSVRYWKITEKK